MCPRASYMAYRCYIAIAYGYLLASILHVVFCVLCTHRFGFIFTVDLIKVVPLFINLIFESQHVMKSMNKNIKDKDILLQMLSVDIPNWCEHLFILIYKTA